MYLNGTYHYILTMVPAFLQHSYMVSTYALHAAQRQLTALQLVAVKTGL